MSRTIALWLQTAALLLLYGLAVHSLIDKSPTFDEQSYIMRGLGCLRGAGCHMRVGHPLGLNALTASLLVFDESVNLPTDDPSWALGDFHRPAELFLWEIGNDVETIMLRARMPTVWLTMLLVAVAGRWLREATCWRLVAICGVLLLALDPNLLANGRLTTTDLGVTAGGLLASYGLWRFVRWPTWANSLFFGVTLGLLANTKYTAGLFVPFFALVLLSGFLMQWRVSRRVPVRYALTLLMGTPLAAFVTLWAAYGFDISVVPESVPSMRFLAGRTLPLGQFLTQLAEINDRAGRATPAYLLGNYSDTGWWGYFPVAFALKTPLPTLLLLILAVVVAAVARPATGRLLSVATLVPALGFFAFAMTTGVNIGYRHILPVIPLLIVFGVATLGEWPFGRNAILPLLAAWLSLNTLSMAPDFLPFFNRFAGGPHNGWTALVDSNIDWGQDLYRIPAWMAEHGRDEIWLSYFGEARPDHYGIDYRGLPSNPPRLSRPDAREWLPADPAAGTYAISVTNLMGATLDDRDTFAYFRHQTPIDKLGYSIFLYDVPPVGQPVDLFLGSTQLDQLPTALLDLLASNQRNVRWFDAGQSVAFRPNSVVIIPVGQQTWLESQIGAVEQLYRDETLVAYRVAASQELAADDASHGLPFTQGEHALNLLSHDIQQTGDSWQLTTAWRIERPPSNLKLFWHIENGAGELVAQWDGLGMLPYRWQPHDQLLQRSTINIIDLEEGEYALWLGLYDPATGMRWQIDGSDRVYLGSLSR